MAADALSKFSEAVLSEAGSKRQELIRQFEEEKKERLAQKDKELERWKKKAVAAGMDKLRRDTALSVSRHRADLKKNLFGSRRRLAEEIFSEVEKNIRAFMETAEYTEYLRGLIEGETEIFAAGETNCLARAEDIEKLKPLLQGKNVVFEPASGDIVGGFFLKNPTLHLCADCTLRTRLEEQKRWFYENSGMIVN